MSGTKTGIDVTYQIENYEMPSVINFPYCGGWIVGDDGVLSITRDGEVMATFAKGVWIYAVDLSHGDSPISTPEFEDAYEVNELSDEDPMNLDSLSKQPRGFA